MSIIRECPVVMSRYLGNCPGVWETSVQYMTNMGCLARQRAKVGLCGFLAWPSWSVSAETKLTFKTSSILKCKGRDKATLHLKLPPPYWRYSRLDFWVSAGWRLRRWFPLLVLFFPHFKIKLFYCIYLFCRMNIYFIIIVQLLRTYSI